MAERPLVIAASPSAIGRVLSGASHSVAHLDPGLRRALATRVAGVAPARSLGFIRLDGYVITKVLNGSALRTDGPFHWTPRATRRIIGGPAAQLVLSGVSPEPLSAVRGEISRLLNQAESRQELRSGSLARWLYEAPESLRVAVTAEALTYASEVIASVDLELLDGTIDPSVNDPQWAVPGAPWISLRGRRDLDVVSALVPGQRSILALRTGTLGLWAARDLGIVALSAALCRPDQPLPARIVGLWGASGRALVLPVTPAIIKQAAREVLSCVEALNHRISRAEAA